MKMKNISEANENISDAFKKQRSLRHGKLRRFLEKWVKRILTNEVVPSNAIETKTEHEKVFLSFISSLLNKQQYRFSIPTIQYIQGSPSQYQSSRSYVSLLFNYWIFEIEKLYFLIFFFFNFIILIFIHPLFLPEPVVLIIFNVRYLRHCCYLCKILHW